MRDLLTGGDSDVHGGEGANAENSFSEEELKTMQPLVVNTTNRGCTARSRYSADGGGTKSPSFCSQQLWL